MFADLDLLASRHVEIVDEDVSDGRVGFPASEILDGECLARLTGPEGRIYSVWEFVPCLEAMGAGSLIDRHVLGLVLDQFGRDRNAVLGCNLSADNLEDEAMWDGVLEQVCSYPHLAHRLVLELAEAELLPRLSFFTRMIADIRRLGCRVALDEFGAGFASPRLAQSSDFDIIKVDSLFLDDIRRSADGSDSFRHMVGLASCFAPIVVAEGVETKVQGGGAR